VCAKIVVIVLCDAYNGKSGACLPLEKLRSGKSNNWTGVDDEKLKVSGIVNKSKSLNRAMSLSNNRLF